MAKNVPHEYREKILLLWLPNATANMANDYMRLLFEAWFVFIDPNGIRKDNCPRCVLNVLENWKSMKAELIEEEKDYNLLNVTQWI